MVAELFAGIWPPLLSGFSGLDMALVASANIDGISRSCQCVSCTVSIEASYFTTVLVEYSLIYI
ncbi:hypothetical protein ACFS07_07865 [Undibacterium arcticum]